MDRKLLAAAPVRAVTGVMACEFGEGLALLHHDSGTFFVLDELGSFIWKRLADPITANDIAVAVREAYDVEDARAECDVRSFVEDMFEAHLIQVEAIPH